MCTFDTLNLHSTQFRLARTFGWEFCSQKIRPYRYATSSMKCAIISGVEWTQKKFYYFFWHCKFIHFCWINFTCTQFGLARTIYCAFAPGFLHPLKYMHIKWKIKYICIGHNRKKSYAWNICGGKIHAKIGYACRTVLAVVHSILGVWTPYLGGNQL